MPSFLGVRKLPLSSNDLMLSDILKMFFEIVSVELIYSIRQFHFILSRFQVVSKNKNKKRSFIFHKSLTRIINHSNQILPNFLFLNIISFLFLFFSFFCLLACFVCLLVCLLLLLLMLMSRGAGACSSVAEVRAEGGDDGGERLELLGVHEVVLTHKVHEMLEGDGGGR